MDSKIFSLACSGQIGSGPYAWELVLGNMEYRNKLLAGECVCFKLEDDTQMCLKMVGRWVLLAESITTDGYRSTDWYCAESFLEDDEEPTAREFLRRIYLCARRQKPEHLLGAFPEIVEV